MRDLRQHVAEALHRTVDVRQLCLAVRHARRPSSTTTTRVAARHVVRRPTVVHSWRPPVTVHRTVTVSRVPRPPLHPHGHRTGIATWYSWHPGQCATSYRPKGSRIWIRDLATGKVVSCVVTDYQGPSPIRIVDLNETQFAELAPLAQGVIRVTVTW